jgi:hypothetical protein
MDDFTITGLYQTIIERTDDIDGWLFRQKPDDYAALLAARAEKMKPVIDEAWLLLAAITPFCAENPEAKAIRAIAEKIEIAIYVEKSVADFLQAPAQNGEMLKLEGALKAQRHLAGASRVYRYLVWHRRTFPATAALQENGVAAVLRVRNESHNLRAALPVLLTYFDEIVVVDHNSSDDTYAYVAGLDHPKIKLFHYAQETAPAGEFYAYERQNGKGSLADYYNFAFAQATAAYVCKWDADMYPLPTLGGLIDAVRKGEYDYFYIDGVDCLGYHTCNAEARIFKRAGGFHYFDEHYFENLDVGGKNLRVGNLDTPVYLHMKQDALLKMKS